MDARIFRDEPMGLRSTIVDTPLASRFHFDAAQNLFFIDFENLRLRRRATSRHPRPRRDILALGRKVPAVVNYHGFDIQDDLIDPYANMIKG
jgi:propionate CoA-transferase